MYTNIDMKLNNVEASYFDGIDMTEYWLEFDRKISQR